MIHHDHLRPDQSYSIQQASELLRPFTKRSSYLGTRYSWPNPHRRANGYRAYNAQLVSDLTRAASSTKEGHEHQ